MITMNESITATQEQAVEMELTEEAEQLDASSEPSAADEELQQLQEALIEARVKLALLMCGAAKSKLSEGEKLAAGFVAAGASPEEAAEAAVQSYPHLKLTEREVPTFAAATSGKSDGFAAIRGIFAKR
ncbi:MAG: hypothetical protein IJD85_05545 [Oscillospiraceae bacterium]|nr:hypothetical protein [Oscillospiraceae bacterium]